VGVGGGTGKTVYYTVSDPMILERFGPQGRRTSSLRALMVHSSPLSSLGGAEISLREHLRHRPDGVSVDVALPDQPVDLDAYDVIILANLRPVAPPSNGPARTVKKWVWERINRGPFQMVALQSEVAWAEAWCERIQGYRGYVIKTERDIHPCVRRDAQCIDATTMRRTECGATRGVAQVFERLYNLCDAVQFLSPLHRRAVNLIVNIGARQYEIAPPLDEDLFRDYIPAQHRKDAALLLADDIRSSPTAERRAREAGFRLERLKYLSVPYEEMPALLNRYRAVVVDPVMLHGFGRLAVEALACGCRLIASERVGAISWADPLEACRKSNVRFWEMVMNRPARPNPRRLQRANGSLIQLWN
jgi:hypothetical protein